MADKRKLAVAYIHVWPRDLFEATKAAAEKAAETMRLLQREPTYYDKRHDFYGKAELVIVPDPDVVPPAKAILEDYKAAGIKVQVVSLKKKAEPKTPQEPAPAATPKNKGKING